MRYAALALLLLLAALTGSGQSALAAEPIAEEAAANADGETAAADAASGSDDDTASEDAAAERNGSLDGEGFVPSVQISEDLSVSFPTDI